jgi:hypothetical protein
MKLTIEQIDKLEVHFVLCTERTGSSLFSLFLNLHDEVLSPAEDAFVVLYFLKAYKNKTLWSNEDINKFTDELWLLSDNNLTLYFSKKTDLLSSLLFYRKELNFFRLIKICYLHFFPQKDISQVHIIVEKQVKYPFHIPIIREVFPNAKFIVLTRDVRDNIVSKQNRRLHWHNNPLFLAVIWNRTYSKIAYLNDCGYLLVRYEDLVTNTEYELQRVCQFIGVQYHPKMANTAGIYKKLITESERKVNQDFVERLLDFHSGLFQKPDTSKIGQYKTKLDNLTLSGIEAMNKDLFDLFGYNRDIESPRISRFQQWIFHILAYCYRDGLLNFYYLLPLKLKIWIKKIRGKRINV